MAASTLSAMPRTGAPPTIGESPTTGAAELTRASRMPGTASMVPMLTTGLDGGSSTRSAVGDRLEHARAGLGVLGADGARSRARPAAARSRTQYSWKCTALRRAASPGASGSSMTTWVSTRSSLIGSSRTPRSGRPQRAHSASVTWLSG